MRKDARVVLAQCALGDGDDAEVAASLAAPADGLGDALHVVGDLGDEDHVGAAGESAPSVSQPARWPMISTTMMRWWLCAVLCRRSMASVAMPSAVSKPKVDVGHGHVVVDGLGQRDDVEAGLVQAQAFFCVPPPPRQTRQSMPPSL